MARGGKRNKVKEWLSRFFPPKREMFHTLNGPQQSSGSSYQNIHIDNSTKVFGSGHVVTRLDGQGDRQMIVTGIMNLLSQHIIRGAAHDDSARDPPPRCHPDTRAKLLAQITAWFNGEAQQELLLWLTGPAGVGKSAIIQTFAEYLAGNHLLGASVFISRPNGRNKPHGIFVTIAYQLSIRIEAYRNFITERLSVDPELLNRGMAAQFAAFIIEPFVERKIGVGGKRWGILLDGLDELQGEDAQCQIIQLITAFAHEHHDAPLAWIIASRPEPHISDTFDDDANRSHWSEYIPIDSTEACADVERFLRSSFETTRRKYRRCVPSSWPSDTDLLKVTVAASGLFVYAEVVMNFVRDPTQADPAARLEILLTVIDRSNAVQTSDNPFVHLDALYREILSSIPSTHWPSTKRLLSYVIHAEQIDFYRSRLPDSFRTLRGMAILSDLPRHVIYTCFLKCHSTLRIPDWKVAYKKKLTVLHASFADYLKDPNRSGDLYVGNAEDVQQEFVARVLDIWHKCSGGTAPLESTWHQYCSKWDDRRLSGAIANFHAKIFHHLLFYFEVVVIYTLLNLGKDTIQYAQLRKVHMIKLCHSFSSVTLEHFARLVDRTNGIGDTELLRKVRLKSLKFGNLDWEDMSPASAYGFAIPLDSAKSRWILDRPRTRTGLQRFVSELESLLERLPELEVSIVGAVPEGRVAIFRVASKDEAEKNYDFDCYIIPYPE